MISFDCEVILPAVEAGGPDSAAARADRNQTVYRTKE